MKKCLVFENFQNLGVVCLANLKVIASATRDTLPREVFELLKNMRKLKKVFSNLWHEKFRETWKILKDVFRI